MLDLIGRKADGWLPSLAWLEPEAIMRSNAIIDAAAIAAGRQPSDVRRLVNVTGEISLDELTRLAVEDGFSVFIVASDEPEALRRFASETVASLRQALAGALGLAHPALAAPAAPSGP